MAIIKNKIITIAGFPGSGKTLLGVFLSSFYPSDRVYTNFEIFKNNKLRTTFYDSVSFLQNLKFQERKGIIIIDEGGANANSRRSMSNRNLIFGKLIFLSRKLNCDLVVIGQIEESIDNYFRKLSEYFFLMYSYQTGVDYLLFEAMVRKQSPFGITDLGYRQFDFIKFLNKYKYSYNTIESSIIM